MTAVSVESVSRTLEALLRRDRRSVLYRDEATGNGFSLDIVPDPQALLGYRLRRIGAGHFATVMLATMEATALVAGPSAIVVNDLYALWSAATDWIDHRTRPFSRAGAGAAP